MNVPHMVRETRWVCPNCDLQDVTRRAEPHTQMHSCRGLLGMTVPMVEDGVAAKTELLEREDYVGKDLVTPAPDGKVYMSAQTTRDEGQDCTVYPGAVEVRLSDVY